MSKNSSRRVTVDLPQEIYDECKSIAEKNGVSVEIICAEFVQFALDLYKEGKLKERSVDESLFTEIKDSELLN